MNKEALDYKADPEQPNCEGCEFFKHTHSNEHCYRYTEETSLCKLRQSVEQPPASDFTKEFNIEYFKYHYGCEWDTDEFLGWDEVWICIEQLYGNYKVRLGRSEAGERILEERIEKLSDTLDHSEASRKELLTALEEASSDFYYIHQHPEDAHTDAYNFMEKAKKAIKQGECGEKKRKL